MHYTYRSCPCGPIRGIGTASYDLFKAVPYAHADRWESPVPVTQWEGEFDATHQGPACPQGNALNLFTTGVTRFYRNEIVEKQKIFCDEDCLHLNIWTPKNAENLPVMVNFHGGGYENGYNSAPYFQGAALCSRNVILVTANYRLNVLACAVGDGHTGNYGLQDQICALQWIQRNITAFGGDPNRVTIMGESAGAMSVQNMILSPLAAGLFHRAIMQSGGGILPGAYRIKTPEAMYDLWEELKAHFGASTIDELKALPYRDVYVAWKELSLSNPRYATPATPVIDGITIPDTPLALAESGRINRVPTLHLMLSEDMWPHTLYKTILQWAQLMEPHDLPVYGGYFDRPSPGSDHGAFHSCDVKYVFGALDACWRPFEDIDYRISDNLIDYFTSFAKTGVPAVEGLPVWQPLSSEQTRFMHFGNEPCNMENVPEDQLSATQAKGKPFPGM